MINLVIRALIVGLLVTLCSSLLGVSLVLKRFSMIGDGLSHVGFGAVAVAAALNMSNMKLIISIPVVVLTAFLLLRLGNHGKVKGDASLALVSTGAVAVGSLLYNFSGQRSTDICNSLFGSASLFTIGDIDLILSAVLSIAIIILFVFFYTKIFAVTFDESFSRATGIKTNVYNMLLAVLTAVTIVLGMNMMGSLMISALIVFPAMTAMRVCTTFKGVLICSVSVSLICFVIGFFTACLFGWQTGATVVSANIIAFIFMSIAGKIKNKKYCN
ncbi:MAG: metal ABC transporter permease [Clostridia bacterium]|nr:metal ABC transporter permease [Clostridia bacterium]